MNVLNLLRHRKLNRAGDGKNRVPRCWGYPAIVLAGLAGFAGLQAQGQSSTGDPTPNALELGPRCPTCPIVIPARPLSAKDKQDRDQRNTQKRDFRIANTARKQYIDDETNKVLILARDLKAKVDKLGGGQPSPTMQREAAVIELLAKDIKEKMKLSVNPD